jgi:hypothetical protein
MKYEANCERRARRGAYRMFNGKNANEIHEFTGLMCFVWPDGHLILRNPDGSLFTFGPEKTAMSLEAGDVVMYGEDDELRLLKAKDFERKYRLLQSRPVRYHSMTLGNRTFNRITLEK